MADHKLPDGSVLELPDNLSPEAKQNYITRAEAQFGAAPQAAAPEAAPVNANSPLNIAGRAVTNFFTGLPDTASAFANEFLPSMAMLKQGVPEEQRNEPIKLMGPAVRQAAGIAEMPADAGLAQRFGEGVLPALPFAIPGMLRAGAAAAPGMFNVAKDVGTNLYNSTLVPTALSMAGGEAGRVIGGTKGELIGSLAAPGAYVGARAARHDPLIGTGNPNAPEIIDAARRQDTRVLPSMVSDAAGVKERKLANNPATGEIIKSAQNETDAGILSAANRSAQARGATETQPTPISIGSDVAASERTAGGVMRQALDMDQRNLDQQIGLEQRLPVTPTLDLLQRIQQFETAERGGGMSALIADIQRMAGDTADPRYGGGPTISQGQMKNKRSSLGQATDTGPPMPSDIKSKVHDEMTAAMRVGAKQSRVPAEKFDAVQRRTAQALQGDEGPLPTSERIAAQEPGDAYNTVIQEGVTNNPQRLRDFETRMNDTNQPEAPGRVFGNYLQKIINETLAKQSAASHRQFSDRWNRQLDGDVKSTLAGPEMANMNDVATLSDARDVRTSKNGLGRATGGVADDLGQRLISSEAIGALGNILGGLVDQGATGGLIGRIAGPIFLNARNRGQANKLMDPSYINEIVNGKPGQNVSMADIIAALNAAAATRETAY